jgi:CRISPR-associated Csx2 family protein
MTTLISFLGRGKEKGGSYSTACYLFDDGPRTVPFFGMALVDYLKPDRLILLGTSGSMWDVFFEHTTEAGDETFLALIEAVSNKKVSAALLEVFAERLSKKVGIPVECLLIDYARDTAGQTRLLSDLAEHLHEREEVAIDITHSFRHLPMLALVAARFLAIVKKVSVRDIYYGALEMREANGAPVIRLKGLLDMLDWLDALVSFDRNGDYGVFAPLFAQAGDQEAADSLKTAAFYERTNQLGPAKKPLNEFARNDRLPKHPMFELFHSELEKRMNWMREKNYGKRQFELAQRSLANGDFVQASAQGFESVISFHVAQSRRDPMNYKYRDEAKNSLEAKIKEAGNNKTEAQRAYLDLRDVRNTLAHGSRSDSADIQRAVASESALREFLTQCLDRVARLEERR